MHREAELIDSFDTDLVMEKGTSLLEKEIVADRGRDLTIVIPVYNEGAGFE
jgi:hypothetical protein